MIYFNNNSNLKNCLKKKLSNNNITLPGVYDLINAANYENSHLNYLGLRVNLNPWAYFIKKKFKNFLFLGCVYSKAYIIENWTYSA